MISRREMKSMKKYGVHGAKLKAIIRDSCRDFLDYLAFGALIH